MFSSVVSTDFFKTQNQTEVGEDSFKQYNVITALDLAWLENPVKSCGVKNTLDTEMIPKSDHSKDGGTHILIVEDFLLYTYQPFINVLNQRHFISIPYEKCEKEEAFKELQGA